MMETYWKISRTEVDNFVDLYRQKEDPIHTARVYLKTGKVQVLVPPMVTLDFFEIRAIAHVFNQAADLSAIIQAKNHSAALKAQQQA